MRPQTASAPGSPQMTLFAVYELDTPGQWGSLFNQGHDQCVSLRKTETQTASLIWHIPHNKDTRVLPIAMGNWQLVTAIQDATTNTAYLQAGQVQQAKQGPLAAGVGKLSLGNSLLGGQSTGENLAEVRAYALALGLALRQRLPLPVLLVSAGMGVGASPAATGLGLFARGRMRPLGRPCAGKKGRRTPP